MYTDGSNVDNAAGYGAILLAKDDEVLEDLHGGLGQEALVLKAECYAIIHGAELCKGRNIDRTKQNGENDQIRHKRLK